MAPRTTQFPGFECIASCRMLPMNRSRAPIFRTMFFRKLKLKPMLDPNPENQPMIQRPRLAYPEHYYILLPELRLLVQEQAPASASVETGTWAAFDWESYVGTCLNKYIIPSSSVDRQSDSIPRTYKCQGPYSVLPQPTWNPAVVEAVLQVHV